MEGATRRGACRINEVPGERWELALEFLRDAGPMFVLDGPVSVSLQRYSVLADPPCRFGSGRVGGRVMRSCPACRSSS
jgi:hypothetical protein